MTTSVPVHSTTILSVRRDGQVAIGGDGQVTFGHVVVKRDARKIHSLYNGSILVGFSGASADAFALMERFEAKLKDFNGNMLRAARELAKDWRIDRVLRRLESLLAAVDREHSILISGNGDVLMPEDGILAIGSGGPYAEAAARALLKHSDLSAEQITREALLIAARLCVYTNENIYVEILS